MEEFNFHISPVTANEIKSLAEISKKTFFETFGRSNTKENIETYLHQNFNESKLAMEIATPGSLFFFIFQDEQLIGYLKVNTGKAQSEPNENALEIERIYVLTEFHHRKAGLCLFEKARSIAIQNHNSYIWLGVWEHNTNAIEFYKKLGFKEYDQHIFVLGNDKQTDLMMKYNL